MTFAKNLLKLIFAAGVLVSTVSAAGPAGTATFEAPIEISIGDVPDKFGEHAVPRLVDWDSDGDLDLLVGAGDGRVWLVRNQGKGVFANREPVLVDGQPLRLGDKSSTACFANVSGDDKPDLIVAHSDVLVTVFENRGRPAQPMFAQPQAATSNGKPLALPKGCGGRIDAGDWDGDGRTDLVAGAFSGPIVCFHNIGKGNRPEFAPGVPLKIGLEEKSFSYNVHPTLFDVNQDGVCDVAYGMNWGTMGFLTAAPIGHAKNAEAFKPRIAAETSPCLSTGGPIDLRSLAGDDAAPTFGDIDGDGTLDVVSGGRHGKLFWLRGVPTSQLLSRLESLMREHAEDLGPALQRDEKLRAELLGLHHGVYRLCRNFLNTPASRRDVREWYVRHINEHSRWLKHARRDVKVEPYTPSLAYQTWTLLMLLHEGDPDAKAHREFVAETIGFKGRLKDVLVDFGTLIIENGRATPNQLECLHSYLSQIPPVLLNDRSVPAITEVITIGDYLGTRLDVLNAGGVNIFDSESGVRGSSENSFPKDYAAFANDYFGLVLAHELNHRVDATRFIAVPKYNEKYWAHMRKICGPDVKFRADGLKVDWEGTKKHFAEKQLWSGAESEWNRDWANYWLTGPGKSRTLNVCRNETTYTPPRYGIPFFLETRQESIASLANQYFSNSEHMLHFAIDRFERGSPGCLDEWLLMIDVYSLDRDKTFIYRHDNGDVHLTHTEAPLTRNPQGHVNSVTIRGKTYTFKLDADGLVEDVEVK